MYCVQSTSSSQCAQSAKSAIIDAHLKQQNFFENICKSGDSAIMTGIKFQVATFIQDIETTEMNIHVLIIGVLMHLIRLPGLSFVYSFLITVF